MGQLPALYFRCCHYTKHHHPVIWNQIDSLEGVPIFGRVAYAIIAQWCSIVYYSPHNDLPTQTTPCEIHLPIYMQKSIKENTNIKERKTNSMIAGHLSPIDLHARIGWSSCPCTLTSRGEEGEGEETISSSSNSARGRQKSREKEKLYLLC